ncbi:MAG: hypothetical protein Q8N99_03800 [Nanoarchaeota archaeon]|nr:hypothetical protein [Nanoarchaeota archaeon]
MIGTCPNCKIVLKKPPYNNRVINEVMIVMTYRERLDKEIPIKSINEIGFCEICNATLKDLREQEKYKADLVLN